MTSIREAGDFVLDAPLRALLDEAQAAEKRADRAVARERYEELLHSLTPGQESLAASLLRWIGRSWADDGELDAASDCATAALACAEASGNVSQAAHAVNLQAIVCWQLGRLDDAERLYGDAARRAAEAKEERLSGMIEQNLGIIASIRGDIDRALGHYEASLATYRRLGLTGYASMVLNNLGLLYTELRRWGAAGTAYADALAAAHAAGDTQTRIMIEVNRAGFWIAQGEWNRARESCIVAQEFAERVGDERALAEIDRHFGVLARELGDARQAEDRLARARRRADARQDLLLAGEIAREQAELCWRQGRHQETLRLLNESHRLFARLRAQRAMADVDRLLGRLEEQFLEMVRRWSTSIESKDLYTKGHCDRVAAYACALATATGLDDRTLFWFRLGALLHDVGKIVVPSEILNKPGALSPEERAIIERHPVAGEEMLVGIDFPWDIRPMVRSHHEKWAGGGYPDGLVGDAIPESARVLCIADVYDALTSDRPYRPAFSHEDAIETMRQMAHRAFDPDMFRRFEQLSCEAEWPIRPPDAAPASSMVS